MLVVNARNVQQIIPETARALLRVGVNRNSRNGKVRAFPEPVTSVYRKPLERVIFWADRDANPFFHLYESLWMLGGLNTVEPLAQYVERMRNFSDDGVTFHGAYGYRWRNHFNLDQLPAIIEGLKANPDDRRQVLSMWDANADLGRQGKDLPCNLQCVFSVTHDNRLDMMVTNRSNDMIWGAYGANAVHFSVLQEYIAAGVGVPVGVYRQVSNNLHVYEGLFEVLADLADDAGNPYIPENIHWSMRDPYYSGSVEVMPLVKDFSTFNAELEMYLTNYSAMGFTEPFLRKIAVPMHAAYAIFKDTNNPNRYDHALAVLANMPEKNDWRRAGEEWIMRRKDKALARLKRAEDDGVIYDDPSE